MQTREHCSCILHQGRSIIPVLSMEEKECQTRTWSQDLYLMSKREISLFVCQHATGAIQSNGLTHSLHKGPYMQQSSSINISALLDCVSTYLFNQGFSSEGQERRYIKAKKRFVAKNAVLAYVVPQRDRAKGNREECPRQETTLRTTHRFSRMNR